MGTDFEKNKWKTKQGDNQEEGKRVEVVVTTELKCIPENLIGGGPCVDGRLWVKRKGGLEGLFIREREGEP